MSRPDQIEVSASCRKLQRNSVVLSGFVVFGASAPDTIRTYDLGFRKGERARGVVIPYDSRTVRFSSDSLLLRNVVAASRYHAITIDALDGAAQVVRVEVGVALRGGEVGVAGQLLDGDGRSSVPEKLRYEEVSLIPRAG